MVIIALETGDSYYRGKNKIFVKIEGQSLVNSLKLDRGVRALLKKK
jgi:hypothetical protein